MYIKRVLEIEKLLSERSLFLLGPRQTGKTSYIKEQLHPAPALFYNLLDKKLLLRLLADPTILRQEVEARKLKNTALKKGYKIDLPGQFESMGTPSVKSEGSKG